MSEASLFAKIGVIATALFVLALIGKLAWGIGLLALYGLWRGRGPIVSFLKTQGYL